MEDFGDVSEFPIPDVISMLKERDRKLSIYHLVSCSGFNSVNEYLLELSENEEELSDIEIAALEAFEGLYKLYSSGSDTVFDTPVDFPYFFIIDVGYELIDGIIFVKNPDILECLDFSS